MDDTEQVRFDLRADILEACVLYRADIAIARIVDEHIEPAEGFDRRLDGIACCLRVGDIEGQGADLIAVCCSTRPASWAGLRAVATSL